MIRLVLLSCLLAGGLSSKLPSGPEHRSGGHGSHGHHSDISGSSYSYDEPSQPLALSGSGTQYQGSGSQPAGSRLTSSSFNSGGRPSGASFNAGSSFQRGSSAGNGQFSSGAAGFRQSDGSSSTFASASGSRHGSGSSGSSASSGFRHGSGSNSFASGSQGSRQGGFSGVRSQASGRPGGRPGFSGAAGPQRASQPSHGGASDDGLFRPQNLEAQFDDGSFRPQNLEGQYDNGEYRAEELNAAYDDGAYKPTQYSGDDGIYRDDQYAPNNDASYQFQFDAGDHGRQEAADVDGEVEGNFYAVHPNGVRRDVEFNAGVDGFVVTRDESVQGPVPEYALRAAAKPKKVYPEAEIITSLSPEGIFHWEYDAGESSRSEDININTNYYEGTYDFTADDDQNKYRVDYVAGAGIGFVPTGDHLPQQVEETPEVAEAKANFLEKYSVIEAEAKAARKNGYQQAYQAQATAFQGNRQRLNNVRPQAGGQRLGQQNQGFRQQGGNQGYSAPRGQAFQANQQRPNNARPQSGGQRLGHQSQGFRQQGGNQGYSAPGRQGNQQRPSNIRPQANDQRLGQQNQGFRPQGNNQGYSAPRGQAQTINRPAINRAQNGGQNFRQQSNNNQKYSASQSQSFRGPSNTQVHNSRPLSSQSNNQPQRRPSSHGFSSSQAVSGGAGRPAGASSGTRYSGAGSQSSFSQQRPAAFAGASRDDDVHPSMMVSAHALGGHMKTGAAPSADAPQVVEPDSGYLPPN